MSFVMPRKSCFLVNRVTLWIIKKKCKNRCFTTSFSLIRRKLLLSKKCIFFPLYCTRSLYGFSWKSCFFAFLQKQKKTSAIYWQFFSIFSIFSVFFNRRWQLFLSELAWNSVALCAFFQYIALVFLSNAIRGEILSFFPHQKTMKKWCEKKLKKSFILHSFLKPRG